MIQMDVRRDEGFTLVELLIAIVIMGLSVSVLVLAMSSLVVATEEHRGHSVSDTAARDFVEAMQRKFSFTTQLSGGVGPGDTTLALSDPANKFLTQTTPFDVLVDQEVMRVTGFTGNTLTVTRGQAGSTAASHSSGASVTQFLICPGSTSPPASPRAGYLYPDGPSGFTNPTDTSGVVIADVSIPANGIEYWDPATNSFSTNASTCTDYYSTSCPEISNVQIYLPQCDPGLLRVDVRVQTKLDNLRNVTTDTWVLLRRGSNT